MSDRSPVFLMDRRAGHLVEATLIDGVSEAQVEAADERWSAAFSEAVERLRRQSVPRERWPQHGHWGWRKKWVAVEGRLMYRMLGIEAAGAMQGLMLISTAGHYSRIDPQRAKELVYVDYVATAPWNSPAVVAQPKFSLVGRVFMSAAIQISLAEEFGGRIGLHSLPQSETWYRDHCGMTDLGPDANERSNLRYFEMTPEQAEQFLR